MADLKYAYSILEVVLFFTIYIFCNNYLNITPKNLKKLCVIILGLFIFWTCIDYIAVSIGLWTFPIGNTFYIRLFKLPLEEYILFIIHTIICYLILLLFHNE